MHPNNPDHPDRNHRPTLDLKLIGSVRIGHRQSPAPSYLELLDERPPYDQMWDALDFARLVLADTDLRSEFEESARDMECHAFTAAVFSLFWPDSQPDFDVLYFEGAAGQRGLLPPLARAVTRAYAWITTPGGNLIEHGPMVQEDDTWVYNPRPADPRIPNIISFTMVVGPHNING